MKPELTMMDYGRHNADLSATQDRLLQGGSWKRQRIVLIMPADQLIPTKVALSHWGLIFPPNQAVVRILAQGMEVGDAYSTALDQVLAHPDLSQYEYVLTLEHDNVPAQDGVLRLLERMETNPELSAISGLYFTKGEGGVAQIWGDPADPVLNFRPQVPRAGELVECCGTGMGFVLWRMAMFRDEKIPRPLFRTIASATEGCGTQDLTFWREARKHGYRCAVDCAVPVGHFDNSTGINW